MASAGETAEETFELPTEILEKIFSHLTIDPLCNARSTCRCWKTIVDAKQSLVEKLNFTFRCTEPETLDTDYQPVMADVPIRAAILSLVEIVAIDAWWPALGSGLTTLRLFDCKVALARLVDMLRHTPNLVNLTLKSLEYTSLECADPDFRLDRLEKLRIKEDSMFEALIPICPKLKRFFLESGYSEDSRDSMCCKLIKNVRLTLEELDFTLSEYGNRYLFGINEVQASEPIFPNLKRMDILFHDKIRLESEGISIAPYLTAMPLLEELCIYASHCVELNGLFTTNLKKLTLYEFYSNDLDSLAAGAPKLRELQLEGGGVPWWGDIFEIIDKIPTLRYLEVSGPEPISFEQPCLANARPNNLEVLSLYECDRFYAKSLNQFLKLSSQLKQLSLLRMDINDETIEIIGRNLCQLEEVELDIRGYVQEDSAKFIIIYCLKLKKFRIYNYKQFYEEAKKLNEERQRNLLVEYFEYVEYVDYRERCDYY
ncbi:hypothetical protein quinque_011905 [Culex quinquefasciatus]|uniref:uncharacterized protein LOC119766506 n=1 Tax=Culex quinquefasciatus TaxID=7176 RepID=UPI0018E2C4EC|nr:uncharacterized protein LOC119766506 [Culex quinquefasciatus]